MDLSLGNLLRRIKSLKRDSIDKPSLVAFCFAMFWLAGNVISPFLAPAGTIDFGNDGEVGAGDKEADISVIESGFARFFYNAGDANCHQHADRSFFINGNQMPFCARCTAIFFGLVLGVGIMMLFKLELNVIWIIIGLAPMALDGGIQLLTDYESNNFIRAITGCLAGAVTGIALGYIVSELSNLMVQRGSTKKGP